ncbi:MAG: putative DNA modification/repair radical SAM protein [Clostridiales bacterium]|jgi:putative DNA modification/repair radical SAM protein|nr:putative DNA modification/repair radical SAM protein [Clostridiales bacterium]
MEIFADSLEKRMKILADGAKYDASCSSSNSARPAKTGGLGACRISGLCHSFTSDGRCVSLLKLLMSNKCEFDCLYCVNRRSNDIPRASMTPKEICETADGFYRRNYIEGLFLSSAIEKSPDATMQRLIETLIMLRTEYKFRAYIHVKAIPGASPHLIALAAEFADRMSVNIELPSEISLNALAPQKKKTMILSPMAQLSEIVRNGNECRNTSTESQSLNFKSEPQNASNINAAPDCNKRGTQNISTELQSLNFKSEPQNTSNINAAPDCNKRGTHNTSTELQSLNFKSEPQNASNINAAPDCNKREFRNQEISFPPVRTPKSREKKLPAGQTTQMIVGATPDSDGQIVRLAEGLYRGYGLKRVYYSAYVPVNDNGKLPSSPPDLRRENRLYQADWLLRFYGFSADELLPAGANLDLELDPKCDWALKNIGKFPVEVNTASYESLLRVPGIGVRNACGIVLARRHSVLTFDSLKKMRVCLPKAVNFITAAGKFLGIEDPVKIRAAMTGTSLTAAKTKGVQMSIFDGI